MPQVSTQPFRDRVEAGELLAERSDAPIAIATTWSCWGCPGRRAGGARNRARTRRPARRFCGPQAWRARARRTRHGRDCDRRRPTDQSRRRRRARHSDNVIDAVAGARATGARTSRAGLSRRPRPDRVTNKTVILVDDGLATGATMRAAVMAARQQQPARVMVAVPVGGYRPAPTWRPRPTTCVRANARSVRRRWLVVSRLHADHRSRSAKFAREQTYDLAVRGFGTPLLARAIGVI